MSNAGSTPETTAQVALDAINTALPVAETVMTMLVPGSGAAAALAIKIAQGVIAGVPQAIALWNQFQSGTVPTQAQLDAYAAAENTAYTQLMADIAAKLAT